MQPAVTARALPRWVPMLLACLAGLAVNCWFNLPLLRYAVEGDNDFIGFYAGAQLAGTSGLYNADAIARAEAPLCESPRFLPFVRLPFYAAAISPLRWVSYRQARWIWLGASLAATLLFVWSRPKPERWMAAAACCWCAPLTNCFFMGQDLMFVMAALAVSLALFFRGKHFAAGCVFSLCLIKYNLFLPVPLLIAGKRLWRFAGGAAAGGVALLAVSFASGGLTWPAQYVGMLRDARTTPSHVSMPNLNGLFSGLPKSVLLDAASALLLLAAAWAVIRGAEMTHAVAATLLCGVLVSYHAFFADAFLLAPALLAAFETARRSQRGVFGRALLCPLTYMPFLLPGPAVPPAAVLLVPLLFLAGEAVWNRRPASSARLAQAA